MNAPVGWLRRWHVGLVLVILALALRLALLPTARFGGDEALFFRIGMDIVEGRAFPLLGTQITDGKGMLPGPTFLYVMALPLLVVRAPEAQYAFVEVLGALTVVVFWHALRRPFGEAGAALAGLLFALSPWAALYADRTWNPNVLPLVVVLALLAAVRLREDPQSRWLVAFVPLCAVMPHFHMSAPVAWAGLAVLVLPRWRELASASARRHLAFGLALAAVLYVPLAIHEAQTGFGNTRAIFAETIGGSSPGSERHPWGFLWVPVYAVRFLTLDVTYHELTGYWGGPDELACLRAAFMGSPPRPFHALRLLAFLSSLALAITALVVAVRAQPRPWRSAWALAFVAALVANVLLMGAAGKQVFGHYVTNLMPFAFVLYAALGAAVATRARLRIAVAALAAVFCAGGVEATLAISRRVDARIGLEVHRQTLAHIDADGRAEGNASAPVRLDFGFRSNPWDWNIFASRAMGLPFRIDRAAKARRYRLVEKHAPMAPGSYASGPVDVGHALLYRLR